MKDSCTQQICSLTEDENDGESSRYKSLNYAREYAKKCQMDIEKSFSKQVVFH